MSIAEVERFSADLKANETLRAEAGKLQPDKSQPAPLATLVSFAPSRGYSFTAEEVTACAEAAKAQAAGKELTDAELDGVAGEYR